MAIYKNYPKRVKSGSSIYAKEPAYRGELEEVRPGSRLKNAMHHWKNERYFRGKDDDGQWKNAQNKMKHDDIARRAIDKDYDTQKYYNVVKRKQTENNEKKRYNTPYRGGKIAYKFGNSLTEKYLHRKQKTVNCKKKPTTTKRKTIRRKK
jgi:hypothetical protein